MNFLEKFKDALANFTIKNPIKKIINLTINIYFDKIIGKEYKTLTNNIYCLNHPSNSQIVGKANSGKTNILFNLIAQNSIYEKIYIYTNNLDDKYSWLKNKFKNDVRIFINEINFDKISKDKINLVVFDDLVFSIKEYLNFLQNRGSQMFHVFLSVIDIFLLIDY